ncbi:Uu.00g074990.m01.CDS01 [Anthostomella pinea]|uniref:Uu.00g074990.m01.CDS01 n=1 Tax=Anthostomella pinea TaxID=933095 RepID=A0AAI8VVK9_9PEZI|nr:Uu.00g074990.m01.CDS01 [Anthostomella pinea]
MSTTSLSVPPSSPTVSTCSWHSSQPDALELDPRLEAEERDIPDTYGEPSAAKPRQLRHEIARVLKARGMVLSKHASTVRRLQRQWGLLEDEAGATENVRYWARRKALTELKPTLADEARALGEIDVEKWVEQKMKEPDTQAARKARAIELMGDKAPQPKQPKPRVKAPPRPRKPRKPKQKQPLSPPRLPFVAHGQCLPPRTPAFAQIATRSFPDQPFAPAQGQAYPRYEAPYLVGRHPSSPAGPVHSQAGTSRQHEAGLTSLQGDAMCVPGDSPAPSGDKNKGQEPATGVSSSCPGRPKTETKLLEERNTILLNETQQLSAENERLRSENQALRNQAHGAAKTPRQPIQPPYLETQSPMITPAQLPNQARIFYEYIDLIPEDAEIPTDSTLFGVLRPPGHFVVRRKRKLGYLATVSTASTTLNDG